MSTIPRLTERRQRQVEFTFRNKPTVASYRVGAANTLDVAFAGTTAMFDVRKGSTFSSPTIQRRRVNRLQSSLRGLTKAMYDPEDYWVGGSTLPHDANYGYVRISEIALDGTVKPEGPIFIVPNPPFFETGRPNLTVSGTAPNVAGTLTEIPPEGALHFVPPRYSDNLRIKNVGGASIFVAFNPGQPMVEIPSGENQNFFDGTITEVFLRGDGATVAFDAYFAIVNGNLE